MKRLVFIVFVFSGHVSLCTVLPYMVGKHVVCVCMYYHYFLV